MFSPLSIVVAMQVYRHLFETSQAQQGLIAAGGCPAASQLQKGPARPFVARAVSRWQSKTAASFSS
jgi:hypothetical protein